MYKTLEYTKSTGISITRNYRRGIYTTRSNISALISDLTI